MYNLCFLLAVVLTVMFVHQISGQGCSSRRGCSDHGSCNTRTCGSTCSCDSGYTGTDCSVRSDCTSNGDQCGAHGSCSSGKCGCRDNYSGRFCDIAPPIPVCSANGTECGDHGECDTSCIRLGGKPSCWCFDGYTGPTCRAADPTKAGTCVSDRGCNNHGTCVRPGTCSSSCECRDGYTGKQCEISPFCTVDGGECGAHGTCFRNSQCICKDRYRGTHCEIVTLSVLINIDKVAGRAPCGDISVLDPRDDGCGDHGECNTCFPDQPFCQCFGGYGGDKCEKAPVCTHRGSECKNGGTCDITKRPYVCKCPSGFQHLGPLCEVPASGATRMTYFMTSCLLLVIGYITTHHYTDDTA